MTEQSTESGTDGGASLAQALEREHHEIDAGIESFLQGASAAESLLPALVALRRHIYLEEEFLFPPLRAAGLMMPIMVMIREHGALWDTMGALQAQLDGGTEAEAGASGHALLALLESHNSKEEPILYSQADPVLAPEATADLHDFIESGQMPEGWVCERATR
ncbi:MAG: hemerythrin domain-containing protein [Dermatophilaceae bacterium]